MRSLLLAASTFTVVPLPPKWLPDMDRRSAAAAMAWLPVVGAGLGAAGGSASMAFWRGHGSGSALLGATVGVLTVVLLTRGLHLDGLADLADGLGSRLPAGAALDVMRRSDIGPFGVAAVVAALLLQVVGLATALSGVGVAQGVVLTTMTAATGRYAALDAARTGLPAARTEGFGAYVAGSATLTTRWTVAVGGLVAGVLLAAAAGFSASGIGWLVAAAVVGVGIGRLVSIHIRRRLGGVTGDVFGALIETASTAMLLVLAGAVVWGVLP